MCKLEQAKRLYSVFDGACGVWWGVLAPGLYTAQFTVYSIQCTVYSVQCTVQSHFVTLYIVRYQNAQCTVDHFLA